MTLALGASAPDFTLPAFPGGKIHLKDLRGKKVILYFYPKDDTPGCTVQACGYQEHLNELHGADAVVLGVSRDSLESHKKFAKKYHLTFPLLSDPDGKVHQAYGAWGERVMYGKKSMGPLRTTVMIDPKGVVRFHQVKVQPEGDADRMMKMLGEKETTVATKKTKKASAKKASKKLDPAPASFAADRHGQPADVSAEELEQRLSRIEQALDSKCHFFQDASALKLALFDIIDVLRSAIRKIG